MPTAMGTGSHALMRRGAASRATLSASVARKAASDSGPQCAGSASATPSLASTAIARYTCDVRYGVGRAVDDEGRGVWEARAVHLHS
eukprot:366446-Chlamydomonas_euryale.AAC.2